MALCTAAPTWPTSSPRCPPGTITGETTEIPYLPGPELVTGKTNPGSGDEEVNLQITY